MTMVGSALIAFLVVNTYYHQFLKSENDAKNMEILQAITSFIENNESLSLQELLTTEADVGYKLLLVKDGEPLQKETFGEPFRSHNLSQEVMEQVLRGDLYHGMRDLPNETFVTGFFSDELANTVGAPFTYQGESYALFLRPNIKMLFTEVHYLLGGLFVGMGLISLIAIIFVAHRLIKPLKQLTEATENVRTGTFAAPLSIHSNDEIGTLAHSFMKMTEALKKADERQKQFISDVSHDFQTPLQQMKGYTALIREGDLSVKEQDEYLSIIERETERLSRLSRQLLMLMSLDQADDDKKKLTFRMDEQIKSVLSRFRWQLEKKNISLTASLQKVIFHGYENYTEQLWENLISNAIKYTPDKGEILVSLKNADGKIIFTISDTGIGIAEENIPLLFDRFYRGDKARTSKIEGTGLGLAIVQEIVELHQGEILIDSHVNEGTTVKLLFEK